MKIHLRFARSDSTHTHAVLFMNGANCGNLCLLNADVPWLNLALNEGCRAISPAGRTPIEFISSGIPGDASLAEIDAEVKRHIDHRSSEAKS